MGTVRKRVVGLLVLVAWVAAAWTPARGADHRDGPRTTNSAMTLGGLDINDVYLFVSPANRNNTVAVMTVGGAAVGIVAPPYFFPGGVYEFRVSNDGVNTDEELVLQVVFSAPDQFLRQAYNVVAMSPKTGAAQFLGSGVTGRPTSLRGGGKIQAGLFDDPFFFDLIAFNKFKAAVEANRPLAERVAPFLPPNFPNNFFGNFNVLAIVVEVPRTQLQSSRANPNIALWARTLLATPNGPFQFDRMGRPAINTVVGFEQPVFNLPNIQDKFNSLTPKDDPTLVGPAAVRITLAFGLPIDQSVPLAAMLLPDVLTFDTTNTGGFLNGRRLADDVIDAELSLLTGGKLTSDRVGNDSVFFTTFPYLGTPQPKSAIHGAIRALQQIGAPVVTPGR